MNESAWTSTRRSAGVTCAAALAILGSATAFLVWGSFFLGILNSGADVRGRRIYEAHPVQTFLIASLPFLLIASGIRLGVGLFQLKAWARKAALFWAVAALCFSLWFIAFRPYQTFFIPEHFVSELESLKQLLAVSLVLATLPVSIWWIFLFRMESVKGQFTPEALPARRPAEAS
jgi:heme/copper-type cytochrome/quinol oxidase subunit 3